MKKCKNCGRIEYDDSAMFCGSCGGPLGRMPKKGINWIIIGGAAVLVLSAALIGGFFLKSHLSGGGLLSDGGYSLKGLEEVENYEMPDMPETIDLYADNHDPSARDLSAVWDKTLFYWLEDTGGASGEGNYIASCLLSRMSLYREDNGNRIDYEVYRDEDSGEIYKIVSIEQQEEGTLELTDYYYDNGSPNFIFRRYDSVYTPTYASIDQVGERYYFNQDQMVKWRWIYEPQVVKQWILSLEDTWYTQWAYPDISQAERDEYDAKEREMLNAAYNTYAAARGMEDTEVIFGLVTDSQGNPLAQADVAIGTLEDGQLFAKLKTDDDGRYAWKVEDRDEEYFLVFQAKGMESAVLEPGAFGEGGFQGEQEPAVLYEKSKETYTAELSVVQVEEKEEYLGDDGNQDEGLPAVEGAEVEIRAGMNRRYGEALASGETDESGAASFDLKPGVYTAIIRKKGLSDALWTFQVDGDMKTEACMVKAGGEGLQGWTAVLTWNKDKAGDLDSTLFTPQKSTGGNMGYINTLNRKDGFGNKFLYDSTGASSCEVIQIAAPEQGSYRYYVYDYEGCLSGDGEGGKLSRSEAAVTLYKDGQFVRRFSLPRDEEGVIWEVFELQNGQAVPIQSMYGSAEGKEWWIEDKEMARVNDEVRHGAWIQSDGEWLYFINSLDGNKPYYMRKDGSDLTKINDDSVSNAMILVGDRLNYLRSTENGLEAVSIKNDGSDRRTMTDGQWFSQETPRIGWIRDDLIYTWTAFEGVSSFDIFDIEGNGQEGYRAGRIPEEGGYDMAPDLCYADGFYYYSEGGYLKKRPEDGATEEILGQTQGGCIRLALKKGWLYFDTYGGSYRMKADGSGEPMAWDNSQIFQEEERVEIGGEYYGKDMKVYDAGGNVLRDMFDTAPFIEKAAMEAYDQLLRDYVPQVEDAIYPGFEWQIRFASVDINGDGMKELMIGYDIPLGSAEGYDRMDIYRYDRDSFSVQPIAKGIYQEFVFYDSSSGCLSVNSYGRFGTYNYWVWKVDGNSVSEVEYHYICLDTDYMGDEGFLPMFNTYFRDKPLVSFLNNTEENRSVYLTSGRGTGFEEKNDIDWLRLLPEEYGGRL